MHPIKITKIVQRSVNKNWGLTQIPRAQGQVLQVILRGHIWFLWKGCSYTSEGFICCEIKVFSYFLRIKKYRRSTTLPPRSFSLTSSDKNFEIAILLKIVQSSDNENSGVDTTSRAEWQVFFKFLRVKNDGRLSTSRPPPPHPCTLFFSNTLNLFQIGIFIEIVYNKNLEIDISPLSIRRTRGFNFRPGKC